MRPLSSAHPRAENAAGPAAHATPHGHRPQLDALRAGAVALVLLSHYVPEYFQAFNLGYAGVLLFFVISGFLITGILLDGADAIEAGRRSRLDVLRRFYVRRTLRIFPLYYAVLLVCLLSLPAVRATWAWHLGYAVNFELALSRRWIGPTGLFWSLGVEEQFYLLWPFVILHTPRRWRVALLSAFIVLGPASRVACALASNPFALQLLPSSCLDSLGAGSLLAVLRRSGKEPAPAPLARCLAIGGTITLAVLLALRPLDPDGWVLLVLAPTCVTAICVVLVDRAAQRIRGPIGAVLEWRPVLYVGKISYGIYVFHLLTRVGLVRLFPELGSPANATLLFGASLAATVSLASISWHLFEGPINGLKDRWA